MQSSRASASMLHAGRGSLEGCVRDSALLVAYCDSHLIACILQSSVRMEDTPGLRGFTDNLSSADCRSGRQRLIREGLPTMAPSEHECRIVPFRIERDPCRWHYLDN